MTDSKKVLIVEDDEMISTVLEDEFKKEGFNTIISRDGEDGLNKILNERPDAVILDISMPKKDGLSVLHELHKKEPENQTPIIVLTNSNDIRSVADAIRNKAVAYLVKSEQKLEDIPKMVKTRLNLS